MDTKIGGRIDELQNRAALMCGACTLLTYEIGNVGTLYTHSCTVCEMEGAKGNEDSRGGRSREGQEGTVE